MSKMNSNFGKLCANYVVFDEYRTNATGAWYFAPDQGEFCKGTPCHGFGTVKYVEGSVYTGELYYDGEKFNKIGMGQQDFCRSTMGNKNIFSGLRRSKYIGSFDYRKTDWIYGNGVMYFVDDDNQPQYFVKGFFSALEKIGEWQGTFDPAVLAYGYTPDMELACEPADKAGDWMQSRTEKWREKSCDVLFIGDSYFEFGNIRDYAGKNLFSKVFPESYVDIGIGGTKFCEWLGWLDSIADIADPRKIVINLGFNDLHGGRGLDGTYADYIAVLNKLRKYFPTSQVYLIQVIHSPFYADMYELECKLNDMTTATAAELGVQLLDWNDKIVASGKDCFHSDKVHPNEYGYALLEQAIAEAIADKGNLCV